MNNKYLLAIIATIAVMFFLFSKDKKEFKKNINDEIEEEFNQKPKKAEVKVNNEVLTVAASTDVSLTKPSALVVATSLLSEKILTQFSLHLKNMNKCLRLNSAQAVSEKTEPRLDNLLTNLKSSLGDVVVQMDDWTQVEVTDANNSKKRIRVDFDYPDGATANRRLSMYQINSYNMPEIVNLTTDQANNPNQAYVDSLIEGNKIIIDEKGARSYFTDGEELIYSIRNGNIQSLSINKSEFSYNCFNLDQENSSCSCP